VLFCISVSISESHNFERTKRFIFRNLAKQNAWLYEMVF